MVNFISKPGVFFMGLQLNDFKNSYISCGMVPPHIIGASDFAIRKFSFITQNKDRVSMMNLRSLGPDNHCKSKMQDPLFRAYSRVSKR